MLAWILEFLLELVLLAAPPGPKRFSSVTNRIINATLLGALCALIMALAIWIPRHS